MPNMNTARTLASVERALTNMSFNSAQSKHPGYLACRYAPFEHGGGAIGVPDGNGRNTTLRDYFTAMDIKTDDIGCDIVIVPWIPIQTLITPAKVGGKVVVDGQTFTRPANTGRGLPIYSAHCSATIAQLGNDPEKADTNAQHHIASGRIITVGYRLIYTGKAASCEGTLTADLFSTKVDLVETSHKDIGRYNYDGTLASPNYLAENLARVANVEMDLQSSNLTPTTVVTRPEHGLQGVLARRTTSKANAFKPYHELGIIPIYDDRSSTNSDVKSITASPDYNAPFCTGRTTCPTVSLFDDDFNVVRIRVRTGEANSYRLEVMTCVQFEQGPGFPLISLTKGPMPRNEQILAKDDLLNSTLMAGAPLGTPAFHAGKVQALPQRVRRPRRPAITAPPPTPTTNGKRKRRRRRARKQRQ
uniref:Uncharacterized protein n=1 Tax=Beihai noda-like virus 9 TaxID=1922491 RepID=A0A1L3KFI7_9VIRU|nr:hypothetical protein 2 [Beihai noda-like virus 9]